MSSTVEELSASLVREYLSRKGLKSTLAVLDQELPRNDSSISNRLALAKALRIEKLMKRNKEINNHRTMVEVIVQSLLSPKTITSLTPPTASHDPETPPAQLTITNSSPSKKINPLTTSGAKHDNPLAAESKTTKAKISTTEPLSPTTLIGDNDGFKTHGNPITRTSLDSTNYSHLRRSSERSREDVSGDDRRHRMTHSTSESVVKSTSSDKSGTKTLQPRSQSVTTKLGEFVGTLTTTGIPRDRNSRGRRGHSTRHGGSDVIISDGIDRAHHSVGVQHSSDDRWQGDALKKSFKSLSSDGFETKDAGDRVIDDSLVILRSQVEGAEGTTIKDHKSSDPSCDGGFRKTPSNSLVCQDLLVEDFDLTMETPTAVHNYPLTRTLVQSDGQPISLQNAKALRVLLFGSARGSSFNDEWKRQNFTFCDLPGLEYGLIQHKGGPCGVLACVQSYLLKHLLFTDPLKKTHTSSSLQPDHHQRVNALVEALADILWRAGDQKSAVFALPSVRSSSTFQAAVGSSFKPDHIIERVVLHTFNDLAMLKEFLHGQFFLLEDGESSSCILFLLSVLLTRGVERVKADMDEPTGRLIGAHGYCTQEVINLLLTGRAVTNLFDGEMQLDTGQSKKHWLRGVSEQSEIGFITLFEHYNLCTVGSNYKKPQYPIWVIYSESHYSVLFSTQRRLLLDWQLERRFDLYYYDGLACQEEEIRLTIDTTGNHDQAHHQDKELVSPLDHCIRTKWVNAVIEWNGTDPLL